MPRRPPVVCCLLLAAALHAQEPAAEAPRKIENTGVPMRVPFQCTVEDIRSFGLTCPTQQPCPIYIELSALDSSAGGVFLAGNLHTESATLSSILLASDDGGKSWYEPYERIRAAGLDQIRFFDLENGWIGGQQLGAVPRDPFLLVTHDGGKTWRARPVFGESRAGAIEYFHFDSKTHGMLWIDREQAGETGDRYELLESMTGGESWSVREVSDRPIALKQRAAPTASGTRLRTDAATRSYRVEKQTGERWHPVASFLVRVGECREPEVVLAPEPPPTPEVNPPVPEPAPQPPAPKKPPSLRKP